MSIVNKNKEIREFQKSSFFKEHFKNKVSIKVRKDSSYSSYVTFVIKDEFIDEIFFTKKDDSKEYDDLLYKLEHCSLIHTEYKRPKKEFMELYNNIVDIAFKGVTYYETGDYGTQPNEYWWFKIMKESQYKK
jgi:hypothetical protein